MGNRSMESKGLDASALQDALLKQDEWSKAVIFDGQGQVIQHMKCAAKQEELKGYLACFDNRDKTVGQGFWLLGQHYDVHRFHPPLVYGRKGDADVGEGICC